MSDLSIHPIVLHADLLAAEDDERAPQTQFVAEQQVAFLEALAVTGSVREAARRARVSHQTCYRARRWPAAPSRQTPRFIAPKHPRLGVCPGPC